MKKKKYNYCSRNLSKYLVLLMTWSIGAQEIYAHF